MEAELHQLTKWREAEGLLPEDVGRGIGCTRQTVYRYEAGRMPRQPHLDRLVLFTQGAVTANAWLGKEAADVVAQRQSRA